MKKFYIVILGILLLNSSIAQTSNSSDAMDKLNLLAFGGAAQLKYKMGGESGGELKTLDDSKWALTFPGFKWPQQNTNVWFRTTVNIPKNIGGFSLIGRKMKLYLYIDNGGDVFLNGDSLGSFEWGTSEFVLSQEINPGDEFVLAVRGINKPGWGKVSEFRIEFSDFEDYQKKLQPKYWGLLIAKEVANKLSNNPKKWIKIVDNIANNIVNSKAFNDGNKEELLTVIDKESEVLKELDKELKEKYKLYCAGYAHIDLAWKWPWIEGREVVKNTSESVINVMERFPNFIYSMGQAHAYEWMENYAPNLFSEIKKKVKENKWEIVGGQWCEPDGHIPSGESFVRQSLYAKRYFRDKFDYDVKICWLPDCFGFNWNMPQILSRSGFEGFITARVNLNDTRNFPHRLFWWQGPDGSKIKTYIPRDLYMHDLDGEQVIDFLQKEQNEDAFGKELVLFGVGNHGGGPTMKMLDKASRTLTAPAYPDIKFSTSKDFFDEITKEEESKLSVWNSELYLEQFRGCFTSQANTKKHNRKSEVLVKSAEFANSISTQFGNAYPKKKIFDIWRTILFNHFHDILPGTSVNSVYHDTEKEYAEAEKSAEILKKRALENISKNINTSNCKNPFIVFNPSSWERTSPVEFSLNDIEMNLEWSVLDEHGNLIPSQIIEKNNNEAKLLFIADNIPSLGYKTFQLVSRKSHQTNSSLEFTRSMLENKFLKIEFDKNTGLIKSIYDKKNDKQILKNSRGNLLQILNNERHDAWSLKFNDPPIELDRKKEISLVEFGPVRTTIKVVHSFSGEKRPHPTEDFPTSIFTQYISLYEDIDYLEVRNDMRWWEEHKMLKISFPLNIESSVANYEIPYGNIERSTGFKTDFEKKRFEVPAQRWADISDENNGVALINDCKYGYDIKDNIMRLSLLRAPTFPDPLADKGYHKFKYAIYSHSGDFRSGLVTKKGYEFNEPLLIAKTDQHKGCLPKSLSFFSTDKENIIISSVKISEDNNKCIILRIFETHGNNTDVQINSHFNLKTVVEVNLIEDEIEKLNASQNGFKFKMGMNEIRTFKLQIDNIN